jgi:hypothetical protein
MNAALIVGIYLVFFGFIFIKLNRFHPILNLVSLLSGALIFTFIYPTFTEIGTNPDTNAWTGTYATGVLVLIIPLLLFFVIAVILPLTTKIIRSSARKIKAQLIIQTIGLIIVIIWAFLAAFTKNPIIAIIRPFFLPTGWLIWSITVLMDPFNIMVSNAEISRVFIATKEGLPIYFNDFEGAQKISANLAATLISGVTSALENLVESKGKLSVLNYEKQVLGIVSVDYFTAYVFGERFDRTLETALKFSLESILNEPELALAITPGCIELSEKKEKIVREIVNEALKSVLVI